MALLAESGPSGTLADIPETPKSDRISIYVVRGGDTLSHIGAMFGVSVNTIVWANDIKRSVIHEGQVLIILPISGIQHTVLKGETLKSITAKYKGDVGEIAQFNNLNPATPLAVGNIILIPDGELTPPPSVSGSRPSPARGTSGPEYAGYYLRPVTNVVKTQGLHGYNGIDLGAPHGTPILASASRPVIVSPSVRRHPRAPAQTRGDAWTARACS